MITLTMMLAVLMPGLDMTEQPHLPDDVKARIAVERQLQESMAAAEAAAAVWLAARDSEELRYGVGEPWATLAECESGNWIDGGSSFERGSARWAWGGADPIPPWGTAIHHGGLQFHPDTWWWVAPMVGFGHIPYAYLATPQQQVMVATRVQELQGWSAWPVCSARMGLS